MLEAVLRFVLEMLFAILCWLVFIPIGFVVATPVVFFLALCRRDGTFKGNLLQEYRRYWKEWGVLLSPPW